MMTERGFTLLELLVAMCLGALVAALTYPALKAGIALDARLRPKEALNAKAAFILETLQHEIENSQFLPGVRTVLLHQKGEISFPFDSWTSSPPANLGSLDISPENTAISFIQTAREIALETRSCSGGKFTLCSNVAAGTANYDTTRDSRHWIGTGVDGLVILSGQLKKNALPCPHGLGFEGTLGSFNMQVPGQKLLTAACHTLVLTPLTDSFTLYLDTEQTLKRISHLNSEHQPVARGVLALQFSTTETSGGELAEVTLSLLHPSTALPVLSKRLLVLRTGAALNLLDFIN